MNSPISKKDLREFGYVFGIGIPLFLGWLMPYIFGHEFRVWTLWISIPILLLGIFSPFKLRIIYKCWMKLGQILGWINSRIILGLVFIIVLQPIALIMKLFGYDPLGAKKINSYSYRKDKKDPKYDLTRIF